MYLVKVVGIVAITAAVNAAWGSDFCPSLPAMNFSSLSGWGLWQKACYRLTESKADWNSSKSSCQNLGGMMAAPHSLEEMKFMADLAQQKHSKYSVWIACNDIKVEGNWTCDGQEGSKPFMAWDSGQPNNADDNQDCAIIAAKKDDSMDDARCNKSRKAVCIRQPVCTPRPTQPRQYCFSSNTPIPMLNSTCLLDHVIREFITEGVTACGSTCIKETGCRSFNIKKSGDDKKLCQLNNSTSSEDKDKFQTIGDFCIYMYLEECIG